MVYTSLYCIPRHTKLEYPIETDKSQEPCKITHKIKNLLSGERERGRNIAMISGRSSSYIPHGWMLSLLCRSSPCWKSCAAAAAALDKRNPYPRHTSTTRDHHQLKCDTWRGHKNGDEIADGLIDRLSGESSYMVNSGRRRRCELTREVITVEYMLLLLPPKSSAHSFKLGQSVAIQSRNINRSQRVTIVRPNLQLDWIRDYDDDGKNKRTIIILLASRGSKV